MLPYPIHPSATRRPAVSASFLKVCLKCGSTKVSLGSGIISVPGPEVACVSVVCLSFWTSVILQVGFFLEHSSQMIEHPYVLAAICSLYSCFKRSKYSSYIVLASSNNLLHFSLSICNLSPAATQIRVRAPVDARESPGFPCHPSVRLET